MGRDHRKLVVFTLADQLVTAIYRFLGPFHTQSASVCRCN
jgi:hypothetical protein